MALKRACTAIRPTGAKKQALKQHASRAKDFTNKRACRNKASSERDKQVNSTKSQTRTKVEHPFFTLKRHWGFAKARYRGLAKNANRVFAMLALVNIDKWDKPLGA